MTVSRVLSTRGMSVRRLQHSRRICAMEPPFATPRASQEKGACASVVWFSHRLGAVTSTLNFQVIVSVCAVLAKQAAIREEQHNDKRVNGTWLSSERAVSLDRTSSKWLL